MSSPLSSLVAFPHTVTKLCYLHASESHNIPRNCVTRRTSLGNWLFSPIYSPHCNNSMLYGNRRRYQIDCTHSHVTETRTKNEIPVYILTTK